MGLFAAAAGPADRAIDRVFAGRITVTPMAPASQYRGAVADPERPAFEFNAPVVTSDEVQSIEGARQEEGFIGRISAGEIWISVLLVELAGRELRTGYRLIAHDRPASDRAFQIDRAGVATEGRQKFYLSRIKE